MTSDGFTELDLPTNFAKRTVVAILKAIFSGSERFRYSRDEKHSKVMIGDQYTTNLETVEKQVKIIVGRNRTTFIHQAVDQFRAGNLGFTDGFHGSDLIQVPLTINCVSRGLEAEILADFVVVSLIGFRRIIRETLDGITDIRVSTVGPERPARIGAREIVTVVQVGVEVSHPFRWTVTPIDAERFQGHLLEGTVAFQQIEDIAC